MDSLSQKYCSKCHKPFPPTPKYFARKKRNKGGLDGRCKQCKSEVDTAYRLSHPEQEKLSFAKYKASHREHVKRYQDKYNAAHREQHKQYLEENRDKISEQQRAYYIEHSEHLRQYTSQYRHTERGRMSIKAMNHNRKARKKKANGSHTAEEMQEQYNRQRGRCYYCRVKLGKEWHGDHVTPLSKGGSNSIDNIVIACPDCNQSKYNKLLHEWKDGGRLL